MDWKSKVITGHKPWSSIPPFNKVYHSVVLRTVNLETGEVKFDTLYRWTTEKTEK